MFGNIFWRPYKFMCDDNIICLGSDFLNESNALYFVEKIKMTINKFDYSKQYRIKHLENHRISVSFIRNELDHKAINKVSLLLNMIWKYTNNLYAGLPNEIELRAKQYEYYRNLLLAPANLREREREHLLEIIFNEFSNLLDIVKKPKYYFTNTQKLWQIATFDKKFKDVEDYKQPETLKIHHLLASKMKKFEEKNGDVLLLSTGNYISYTKSEKVKEYLVDDEIISIQGGGSCNTTCNIKYYKGKFITADNRIFKSKDQSRVLTKYIYYYLKNIENEVINLYQGSGIKHPNMNKFLNLDITYPPLEEQKRIVEILDKFSTYAESNVEGLLAEIELRRKQYDYYRNLLLVSGICNK
ncbi:restriction endonuclease subunit S [Mycoplasmopsis caviae]|uniref:Restriction endonuclease subunit S n=1 Tax=Mycoplasmopsis caviae TaxID=55603 RepID=A0ABY5J344_9BACT|nr:restriction endonuclease subunit S [Mycoplasmopsis caviae]UUD35481.1 restriction endonuclease subunit S [Mycoplasmopsis caviae]